MKRIIALLLVAVMSLAFLAGCQTTPVEKIDEIKSCYANSYPHKIVVESTQQFGNQTLISTTTLMRGAIGNEFAAKMIVDGEQLRSIEDGSGTVVYGHVEELEGEYWYRTGKGLCSDGSNWDDEGENFFPDKGEIALNLDPALMTNPVYEGNTLSFTVSKANSAKFFGEDGKIDADATVRVTTGGGFVTNVVVSWSIPANFSTGVDTMNVTIESVYIYDQQRISFD